MVNLIVQLDKFYFNLMAGSQKCQNFPNFIKWYLGVQSPFRNTSEYTTDEQTFKITLNTINTFNTRASTLS